MNMASQNIRAEIKEVFTHYLEAHGHRKTTERFNILDEIYKRNDHFDAETLFIDMKNQAFDVSRATIYNTLDLLVSCGLVTRHLFDQGLTRYEKSFRYHQHDHLICLDCKKVFEFCDPRMQQIETKIGEIMNFSVHKHSLILYGQCQKEACSNLPTHA